MPSGNFVLIFRGTKSETVRSQRIPTEGETPTLADLPNHSFAVRFARRILFIGDDGSVWVLKDKWKESGFPIRVKNSGAPEPPRKTERTKK